ncbi:hypothetical protein Fcan01_27088 [Folsomia candida]|uniref:Uncharacterized protein n=1 Tax=Folsomia candida TaxID=158441 RepID=A0A226D0H9_FOLCA|nr:hypothetical protein Fcan01_27088 [Folsomia candida]
MRIRIGKEKKSFVDSTKYVELCAKTNLSSHQILHSSLGFGWWESAHEGVREPTFSSLEGFARLEESDICGNWSGKQHHCHHLFPLKDDDAMPHWQMFCLFLHYCQQHKTILRVCIVSGKADLFANSPTSYISSREFTHFKLSEHSRSRSKSVGEQQWTNLRAVLAWYGRLRRIKRQAPGQMFHADCAILPLAIKGKVSATRFVPLAPLTTKAKGRRLINGAG